MNLWHGGRDLEYNYREYPGSSKGNWEHGPGLYLTTHYLTARKYAKGNGKTYNVEIEIENKINIEDINISLTSISEFVNNFVIGKKRKVFLDSVYENVERMNSKDKIKASHFLNLIINFDAINSSKTKDLNNFLVENKVDYSVVNNYGGRNETVIVIFNNDMIKKVEFIPSKNVSLDDYEIDISFNKKNQLKII
jgi:hypothetical protein